MNREKINWCFNQKKGIKLVEPKVHLSKQYEEEADESLEVCLKLSGSWKIISGYYACYNSFYSILMKCGVKCEIHDCTLELLSLFDFSKEEIMFIKGLKDKRINSQYYLKREEFNQEDNIKKFMLKCKQISKNLTSEKIIKIRGALNGE